VTEPIAGSRGVQANRAVRLPVLAGPSASPVSSDTLFRGRREIVIVHRGQEYRLRITRMDKLILTK
jgi:hemin uptake protein HemP